jgi:hypothetical protein
LALAAHRMLEFAKTFTRLTMAWLGKTAKYFLLHSKKLYLI